MDDREKVIKAIENCTGQPKCFDCPWEECSYEHEIVNSVPYSLMRDALALVKEQEQAMKEKDGTISNLIAQIKEISQCYERIVRCKDCKNWIPGYITDQDDFIPPKCGKYQQMVGHSNDDFCSLAEKKEGR